MREAIDDIVGELYMPPGDTCLVVGVTEGGRSSVFGYGEKQGAGSGRPSGDTLFEIGSVTKVFTTSLLSLLASQGRVSLDDSVCDVFPTLPGMPPEITLLRLATHTSGLPKMPPDASLGALMNRSNPFANYTETRLIDYLSNYKKKPRPDEAISYSNMGMALLGHILAEKTGETYEEAVVGLICHEIGLPDTRINLTSEQEERVAFPHTGGEKPSRGWDLPAFAGAGALRSTADDVLRFLDAHMGRPESPLTDALKLSHERRAGEFPTPGPLMRLYPGASRRRLAASSFTHGIGLGWVIGTAGEDGPEAHWHHGATGGYVAFAGFVGEADAGTVVFMNRGPRFQEMVSGVSSADEIGFRVLESLCSAG